MDEPAADDDSLYLAIIRGTAPPDAVAVQEGRDAHAAGRQFHEGPEPFHSVRALSWRMGWNDTALKGSWWNPPTCNRATSSR